MIMHGVHPFMLLIGFDRLMSIAFPIWSKTNANLGNYNSTFLRYKTKNGKFYFRAVMTVPIGFEIFIAVLMSLNMAKHTGM
jgi:hypothetical protein